MADESVMKSGDGTEYPEPEPYKDPGAETGDGTRLEERTEEPVMTTGTGDVLSGPDRGSNVAPTEDATKAELYEAAQEADIEGRSSMSKEELAEALAKEGKKGK